MNIKSGTVFAVEQADLEESNYQPRVVDKVQKGNGDLLYWEPNPAAVAGSKVKWYTKDGTYP